MKLRFMSHNDPINYEIRMGTSNTTNLLSHKLYYDFYLPVEKDIDPENVKITLGYENDPLPIIIKNPSVYPTNIIDKYYRDVSINGIKYKHYRIKLRYWLGLSYNLVYVQIQYKDIKIKGKIKIGTVWLTRRSVGIIDRLVYSDHEPVDDSYDNVKNLGL